MIGLHSALLSLDQKRLVKDALVLYIQDLQRKFYRDKSIDPAYYNAQMSEVDSIAEQLNLKDLYRQ
ncbi:hypothetical protein Sn250709_052 [Synechococcus phage S-RIM2]|jgi:hypothetical protein|uniref:Uncharacterized protein n=4 Tax=Nerrivikvirus srim2 TaxID=2734125 RepID=A0A1D7RI26_9CAUD|nr:hypothetical protein SWTG_00025 [Synechococcus phage S-RIM2 R1_1999]AGH06735.1 hypothetical protein SWRG_00041 [Synechococcus phage S-RIM2 R21_2007]AGH06946.1 hypothetical protein SWUG_00036 [Synechococcus phage S-RIM2 R9_2006]AON97565.1 hypothetical protein Fa020709_052 [Synechococcus phage S-RIM2]AGH07156.1 hypothetical protein SWTG_00025 [Synechococcus phage S-RIM2 R1_1999]AON97779.1 hypothetical protein Fa100709_052 [Synechococcus phage S-RIM2]